MDRHDADYLAHRVQEAICNATERLPLGVDEEWLDLHSEKIVEALIGKREAEPAPVAQHLASISGCLHRIANSLERLEALAPVKLAVSTDPTGVIPPTPVANRRWDGDMGCWIEGIN